MTGKDEAPLRRKRPKGSRWFVESSQSREWEGFYRDRSSYDRSVRSSHGINCSGSCSWEVFVKNGLICWELQKTDYPQIRSDVPNYEPRGCARGISASWYNYSPLRVKYPYVRRVLWDMYQAEKKAGKDPYHAWAAIVEDPKKAQRYKTARGKAGWKRVSWDDATEITAAGHVYTIRKFGPDRVAAFSPIPAMSMVAFTAGHRFNALIGGTTLSFYDWYHDLPHMSPMTWGDQTDVHESADWYNSTYIMVIGSNIPSTRTPDAHFVPEFKYNGGKLVVMSPDYSDVTKFADQWIPANPGTDGAFLMSAVHVILKEFFVDRKIPYFEDYVKRYSNLPFLVILEKDGDRLKAGRFLRASDIAELKEEEKAEWKSLLMDSASGRLRIPNGTIGSRWEGGDESQWNLQMRDAKSHDEFDPELTLIDRKQADALVTFTEFTDTFSHAMGEDLGKEGDAKEYVRGVPVVNVSTVNGPVQVTTAFDLLMAQTGVDRGHGGDYPKDYDDPKPFTPAWQEQETSVSRTLVIKTAREWAENAEATKGSSLIISGGGILHWYHGGTLMYRAMALMGVLCGCHGSAGGGWCHYVGTEKIRPLAAVATLSASLDWYRPPRMMNSTSYFYLHLDQWRYDPMTMKPLLTPGASNMSKYQHMADFNTMAVRNGWLPFYPQFDKKSSIQLAEDAVNEGATTDDEIGKWVADQLKDGSIDFAIHDIDAFENHPKVLTVWRANLIGTSIRGHEYALKHFLGTDHSVLNDYTSKDLVESIRWRDDEALGKLDLLVNLNLRMDSSANYSDVVLPVAHWYEKYDMTCTDLHTFFHPFNPAHDPPWDTKDEWQAFAMIAEKFSKMAEKYLPGKTKDVVTIPLMKDTPMEISQPLGEMKDWRAGEVEAIPGKTMPAIKVVTREYPRVHEMYNSFGPLVCGPGGFGAKGVGIDLTDIYEGLKANHAIGERDGRPALDDPRKVAETILQISPESNGEVSYRLFEELGAQTGLDLTHLIEGERDISFNFSDLSHQPRRAVTSPHWTGIESGGKVYTPWSQNVVELVPWRTLTGRQEVYLDHVAYRELGEAFPTYKPPLDPVVNGDIDPKWVKKGNKAFRYLTPHGKWSIHSFYKDTWQMSNIFRGGPCAWINPDDAAELSIKDNEWIEVYNKHGIQAMRAIVSHTISRGVLMVYHQQEKHVNVPYSPLAKRMGGKNLRGGTNNSANRILMNPACMIGGYAQFSYFLNYWGPSPSERDIGVMVRSMPLSPKGKAVFSPEDPEWGY